MEDKKITISLTKDDASELITLLSVASTRACNSGEIGLADVYGRLGSAISNELEKVFLK